MDQISKQTETLKTKHDSNTAKRIIGVIFGLIEIVLGFRFFFKLLDANPDNGFVKLIYNITAFFVRIFEGIFDRITFSSTAVFEPATLIAIVVVALAACLIMALISPRKSSKVERTTAAEVSQSAEQRKTNMPTGTDDQKK